jgi:hypothetical protein
MWLHRVLALCAFGLVADLALAQLSSDMHLEDAGFVMREARTAEALKQAAAIPPRRFVSRVKNGKRYYLYADPDTCKCVFLGNEVAMQTYRDMRKRLPQPDNVSPTGDNMEAFVVDQMDQDDDAMIGPGHILDWTD